MVGGEGGGGAGGGDGRARESGWQLSLRALCASQGVVMLPT